MVPLLSSIPVLWAGSQRAGSRPEVELHIALLLLLHPANPHHRAAASPLTCSQPIMERVEPT